MDTDDGMLCVLCPGMKNCYVTLNLLVTRKNRLLHRKCFVGILFTSPKTLKTNSFATLTSSFLKFCDSWIKFVQSTFYEVIYFYASPANLSSRSNSSYPDITQTPSAFNFIPDNGLIPCPFRNSNGCFNTSHLAKKIITGMISLSFFIFQKIKIVRGSR